MSSVLLLAVNRHQERYFSAIAAADSQLNIKVLHDNRLPLFFWPKRLDRNQQALVNRIAALRLKTVEQEAPGYLLGGIKKILLATRYRWAAYWFLQRALHFFGRHQFALVGLWSGRKWRQQIVCEVIKNQTVKTAFFENGAFPGTTTLDPAGVNFASSIPRVPEFYRRLGHVDASLLPKRLTVRKARNGQEQAEQVVLPERYIFVPFQVDSDTQVVEYSPWIKNMEHLYQVIAAIKSRAGEELPRVLIKEHPSSKNDYRHLHQRNPDISFCNGVNTQELIEKAELIVTINSSVGFESLLLNKPVITLGEAFYNIDGLVQHANDESALLQKCLAPFAPDERLRDAFLVYLYEDYYVKGAWRDADAQHLQTVVKKIETMLSC